jgi:hypothetical protein
LVLLLAAWLTWEAVRDAYRPGVTRANFETIKVGMSWQEVDALLSGPFWDCCHWQDPRGGSRMFVLGDYHRSQREQVAIDVEYDEDGKARRAELMEFGKKSLTQWLLGFIGL